MREGVGPMELGLVATAVYRSGTARSMVLIASFHTLYLQGDAVKRSAGKPALI